MISLLQPSIDGLRTFLLEKNCFLSWNDSDFENNVREYIVSGKLIRGGLLVHLLGKHNLNDALILGSALELTESAFLIQDDIMDHDDLRRGKPSLHVQLSEMRSSDTGISLALCISDYLFFQSQELLSSIKQTSFISELSRYWSTQLKRVCVGQYADSEYASKSIIPTSSVLREMYVNKTSSYSFCIPFLTCAIFSHTPEPAKAILNTIGNNLGILYQLIDDMLNIYGNSNASGKPTGSDIREKKKTLLVSLAYEAIKPDEQKKCTEYYGSTKIEEYSSIATLLHSDKVKQRIDAEVLRLKTSIEELLASALVPSDIKTTVHSLLDFIVRRTV